MLTGGPGEEHAGSRPAFTAPQRVAGLLSLGASVALTVAALWLIHLLLGPRFPPPEDMDPGRVNFNPEPVERLQFLVALPLLPLLLLASYPVLRRWAGGLRDGTVADLERICWHSLALSVVGLLAAGLVATHGFVWKAPYPRWRFALTAAAALPAAGAVCAGLLWPDRLPRLARLRDPAGRAAGALGLGLIAVAGLFGVFGLENLVPDDVFLFNFSAVFHPMFEVHLGRRLLGGLPSQYGLYPYALDPVFALFGLGALSFSVVMSLLNVAAFLLIHRAARSLVHHRVLSGLAVIAILYTGYFFGRSVNGDPYFQYHPIRLFFPALFLCLAWRYFTRRERAVYHASFALASVAVLWNADSGLVVLLSWILTLGYDEAAGGAWQRIPRHLLAGAGALAGTFALFTLYLFLRHGTLPVQEGFFFYQEMFYLKGYGMLPMRAVHPWNLVALVYAAGLLYAVMCLAERARGPVAATVFFLSVMGAGLFSYYQGRSADGNLLMSSYPAVLLAAFFADTLLRRPAGDGAAARVPLVAAFTYLLAFALAGMIATLPGVAASIARRGAAIARGGETKVASAARFVREHTRPGEEVVIVSFLRSVYHLESGTFPPPGLSWFGTTPVAEDKRNAALWSAAWRAKKVFVASEGNLRHLRDRMKQRLTLVDATADGYMCLYSPGPVPPVE